MLKILYLQDIFIYPRSIYIPSPGVYWDKKTDVVLTLVTPLSLVVKRPFLERLWVVLTTHEPHSFFHRLLFNSQSVTDYDHLECPYTPLVSYK